METALSPPTLADQKAILNAYKQLVRVCLPFTTKDERKLIRKAFDFSMQAHGDARRKSGEPYILHPISVARIVVRDLGLEDATAVISALLHDVVEDTFAELNDIERDFGPQVAKIIDGLTKIAGVFDPGSSKQAENFRKMLLMMSDDIRVALIKIGDRLHNMRTLAHMKRETQLKIASETKYLYAPLAHRLGLYGIKSELEDLALSYTEPELYRHISKQLAESKLERDRYIQAFIRPIQARMEEIGLHCEIKGRVKSIHGIYEKMQRQKVGFDEVYDIFAIRIIIDSKPQDEKWDCWRAYSAITGTYRPHPERTRDWISIPRANGYESLHTTVMGAKGRWVEVQIRTRRMDDQAERGMAAHWRYKEKGGPNDQALEHWLNAVRELLENKQLSALDVVSEFKTKLISDAIYVFTPKGDIKNLPKGATILDFAYEIHTSLGHQCIGAKVNHQVVPLSYTLRNGDQVEVITSRKQQPQAEWLDFVATAKARGKIKEAIKEQRKQVAAKGKEIFDWKLRNLGIGEEHEAVKELMAELKVPNLIELFYRLGSHRIDVKFVHNWIVQRQQNFDTNGHESKPREKLSFDEFVTKKLGLNPESLVMGDALGADDKYSIAACCQPIPGDQIVAIEDGEEGIRIHRTTCPKAIELMSSFGHRIVKAKWGADQGIEFLAGFRIVGQDKMGMLNSIIRVVSLQLKRNIRSFTIDTEDGMFDGTIRVYIHDQQEAHRLTEALKRIAGVFKVTREGI